MFREDKEYKFNYKDIKVFGPKIDWMTKMNEGNDNILDPNIIPNFPINKPMKFDQSLMVKAIEYGLVILINYRGEKDKWRGGRERTIQPMVLGINNNTKNIKEKEKTDSSSKQVSGESFRDDEVVLSPKAREIQEAKKLLNSLPDIREKKVADLKEQIENGTYHIEGAKIAIKMLINIDN